MPDIISLSDLQTITRLNSQVEVRRVANGIDDAHRACKKVLGSTGYALVYADPSPFADLLTHLKPWMCWVARERGYPEQYADAEKGGVFTKSGNDYGSVSGKDLSMLINTARTRAEEYLDELLEHLVNNRATYTWYDTNVDGEERIDSSTKVEGGISFRRSVRQDNYRG